MPYLPFTTFVAGSIVILGTFLCFANDHLTKYGLKDFLSLLVFKPQPLIILTTCVVITAILYNKTVKLEITSPIIALLHFGIAIMSLYVTLFFSSIIILMFYDIPAALLKYFRHKEDFEHEICGSFSPFSLHLIVDTGLDWKSACDFSRTGVENLRSRDRIILIAPISFLFVFPMFLGILVPFYYCVYREIFWQSGITDRQTAKSTTQFATNPS